MQLSFYSFNDKKIYVQKNREFFELTILRNVGYGPIKT